MNHLKAQDLNNNLKDMKFSKLDISDSGSSDESSSEEADDCLDDDEDDRDEFCEVKSLFSDKVFTNVIDMFKFEAEYNKFNLIDVVNKYNLDMISYIKMINYIRLEVLLVNLK